LVTAADDQAIKTVEDLAGHTVAVEWGSQAEMEARQLQNPPSPSGRGDQREGGEGEIPQSSEVSFKLLRQDSAATALDAVLTLT
jgi:hypothetical protein